jgi:hypothetical protein
MNKNYFNFAPCKSSYKLKCYDYPNSFKKSLNNQYIMICIESKYSNQTTENNGNISPLFPKSALSSKSAQISLPLFPYSSQRENKGIRDKCVHIPLLLRELSINKGHVTVADRQSGMKKTVAGVQRYTLGQKSAIAGVRWQTLGQKSAIAEVRWQTLGQKSAIAEVRWQTLGLNAPTAGVQRFKRTLNSSRAGRLQLNKENIIIHF